MRREQSSSRRSVVLALALVLAGCGRGQHAPAREDEVVVFAAASLRDAFGALARDFERAHPGARVTLNFAGSQELSVQIEHGAAADVFASADEAHVSALVERGRLTAPAIFAENEPVLVVAKERRGTLRSLSDLPSATRIVLGAAEVPIGRYTLAILDRAALVFGEDFRSRVEARVVSRELNVRQVLAKVSLGEAQAGVVYRTDALAAADRVEIVTIPSEINVVARYPIGVVAGARHPRLARAWVEAVLSADGQRALRQAGFRPAPSIGAAP